MKAIVNIGLRTVEIKYSIDEKLADVVPIEERGYHWETFQKTQKSKKIQCTQTLLFRDFDEWLSVKLLDGRIIDFNYVYSTRSEFKTKADWASYIFQGYEFIEGQPQLYDKQINMKVTVTF
jgi:hypothetical protein